MENAVVAPWIAKNKCKHFITRNERFSWDITVSNPQYHTILSGMKLNGTLINPLTRVFLFFFNTKILFMILL